MVQYVLQLHTTQMECMHGDVLCFEWLNVLEPFKGPSRMTAASKQSCLFLLKVAGLHHCMRLLESLGSIVRRHHVRMRARLHAMQCSAACLAMTARVRQVCWMSGRCVRGVVFCKFVLQNPISPLFLSVSIKATNARE